MSDTPSFWNSQFQFSAILPDFADFLELADKQSKVWAESHALTRLAYGENDRQWIEMAEGTGAGSIVPFFIHGGYWRAQTAEGHRTVLNGLATLGPKLFNAEYRLMPTVRADELMQDLIDAVTCAVEQLASDQKLLILGHSAGGHLSAHIGLNHPQKDRIAGIVPLSGVFDVSAVPFSFLQADLNLDDAAIQTMDLMSGAKDLKVPALLVVGNEETFEFHRQSQLFADLSGNAMVRVLNAHHMSLLQSLHQPDSALLAAIQTFIAGHTPDPFLKGVS